MIGWKGEKQHKRSFTMSQQIVVASREVKGPSIRESIPVELISAGQYRVLASPGYANGFAAGDILELLDSEGHFRVLTRAGNVCVQIFFEGDKESAMREFGLRFAALDGWLDGGNDCSGGHLLIYTIPQVAGFSAIEKAFEDIPSVIQLDTWMYGNVYGDDGVPLGWWN
jgi:hypothetical protein